MRDRSKRPRLAARARGEGHAGAEAAGLTCDIGPTCDIVNQGELIHHNRAPCAERTGFPFDVEHCVLVRRGAPHARDPTAPSASADPGLVLVRGSD